jgi:hypothetical protein
MTYHPIELSPPPQDSISQFGEKGSIQNSEMSISFEGITEEVVRVAISLFNPT